MSDTVKYPNVNDAKMIIYESDYDHGNQSEFEKLTIWHEQDIPGGCIPFASWLGAVDQESVQVGQMQPGKRLGDYELHVYGSNHLAPLTTLAKEIGEKTGTTIDVILAEEVTRNPEDYTGRY